jgi:hypothetical protein
MHPSRRPPRMLAQDILGQHVPQEGRAPSTCAFYLLPWANYRFNSFLAAFLSSFLCILAVTGACSQGKRSKPAVQAHVRYRAPQT